MLVHLRKLSPVPNAEHLNTRQVADRIGRDVATVNRWVRQGKLQPAIQFPGLRGARLFDPADIDRLLTESEVAS